MNLINKYVDVVERKNPYELKLYLILGTIFLLILALINNIFSSDSANFFSFMVIHFLGYLFFLLIPVEGLFVFYLYEGYNVFVLFFLAVGSAFVAHIFDYFVGRLASNNIKILIKKKRYNFIKKYLEKYGLIIIFVFSLFILSSPIAVLIAGVTKLDYKKVFLYSFLGLSLKYSFIAFVFFF